MKSKLIIGNTLETLKKIPPNLFDTGVTSPPYNKMEKNKGWLVKNVTYDNIPDITPEKEYQQNQILVLNELFRITKIGGSFFYNHKIRWNKGNLIHPITWLLKTKWTIRQELIWNRSIAGNIRGWRFWQIDERIYWLIKPEKNNKIGKELESRHAKMTSIWTFPPERNNTHPAPFPLTLPLRAIAATATKPNALVIDPYCGSGTTCLAAKILGHRYIGIDISKNYIQNAKQRLKNSSQEQQKALNEINSWEIKMPFSQRKQEKKNVGPFAPETFFPAPKKQQSLL